MEESTDSQESKKKLIRFLVVTLVVAIIGMVIFGSEEKKGEQEQQQQSEATSPATPGPEKNWVKPFATLKKYSKVYEAAWLHHKGFKSTWWWKDEVQQVGQHDLIQIKTDKIRTTMLHLRDHNDLTRKIYNGFANRLLCSISVKNGKGAVLSAPRAELKKIAAKIPHSQSVVVVAEKQYRATGALPDIAFYRSDWKAIMLDGVELPTIMLAIIMYGELGHALKEKERGFPVPFMSDAFIQEELEFVELEAQLIDSWYNGRYSKLLDKVASRVADKGLSDTDYIEKVFNSLKKEDFQEYTQIVGIEYEGFEVARVFLSRFVIMVGITCAKKRGLSTPMRVRLYRNITNR